MTCQELIEQFLLPYLDGELDSEQIRTLEHHLRQCPECVVYLETYRTTIDLCRLASRARDDDSCGPPEPLIQSILMAQRRQR